MRTMPPLRLRLLCGKATASLRLVSNRLARTPAAVAWWIALCAFCSCAGWILSAIHQLNAGGWGVTFLVGLAAVWMMRGKLFPGGFRGVNLSKGRRRFRRAFPFAFLVLASLAILGGVMHPPSNYDALAYRVPRLLHWLAEGRWHWIHTDFNQVNTRACGIEWLSAPLILLLRTERWLFLINAVSFCLLPGLVFSLFTRVGVRPRVAWHWMWVLPTGYCYLLQAGSISNDMFSTVYALAAIDFALRARESKRLTDLWLSVLSAALLTGAKASNLTLLLPWVVAIAPTWRMWFVRPLAWAAIIPVAMGASFLPMVVLNTVHCGDWTGIAAEPRILGGGPTWLHLFANGVMYTIDNLCPPVFPFASAWNRAADALTPAPLSALLQKYFEPGAAHWKVSEIQVEESAGLGFGITILLVLSILTVVIGHRGRDKRSGAASGDLVTRLVCLTPWVSLIYLMTKLNMTGAVRYLAPSYPLLAMGLLLSPAQSDVVKRTWWRSWALFACGLAVLLVVLSPARPLWPAGWFVDHYGSRLRSNKLAERALNAYEAKSRRTEVFAPLIALVPAGESVVGYVASDFPETSLWKPLGGRRILHVKADDSGEDIRRRGIKYVLLTPDRLKEPLPEWLQRRNARDLQTVTLKMWGNLPPFVWHIVEMNPPGPAQP